MPAPEKFSDYLSIFAVFISSISLYISWRNFRRDRSHLKIKLDFKVHPGRGSEYLVNIVNDGGRTTTVTKVFARLKSKKRYPVFDGPTPLGETQSKEISVPMAGFKSLLHPLGIRAFEVEDSTGKVYRTRTWKLWYHIRKKWSPEIDGF